MLRLGVELRRAGADLRLRIPFVRPILALALVCASILMMARFGALGAAESASATAQYEYNTGHLIVVKHVVNDNGRTAVASDFTLTIGGIVAAGGNSFPGSEVGTDKLVTLGAYSVSETGPGGYLPTFSSGCSGSIAVGQTITCTVTNDDLAAPRELVTLCFRGSTIVVQQRFVASLLARGATLGPC
jgi:Prealbumin-like fold domain